MAQLIPSSLFDGRFEIDRAAGTGGMGSVYRAWDRPRGVWVALKIVEPSPDLGAVEGERFTREAQILSELRHPGIVSYIEHGCVPGGQRYLAMEWLEGEELGRRLARAPLSLGETVTLLSRLASALASAHGHGVIHRDLKPGNIVLVDGACAQAKLLDFGIARRQDGRHVMTRTGLIVGTPEYMAPEQARGQRDIGPATDLFSLGCVIYECLSGRRPFAAEHLSAVLVRILFEDPVPLHDLRPGLPAPLRRLVERMLAKNPAERPADATAVLAALAELTDIDDGQAPTLLVAPAHRASEQHLFSVVLASGPAAADDAASGATLADVPLRRTLELALAGLGAGVVWLLDGTLVVSQTTTGSATDQAIKAARVALTIQEHWSGVTVSLATGLGGAQRGVPVGEVVDRATALLADRRTATGTGRIWLDEVSAGLLARSFVIAVEDGHAFLSGAELRVDDAYLLLGKPTRCVGREQELTTLEAILASCAEESEARAVLVTASAGVGKSRLRHEFLRRAHAHHPTLTVLHGHGDMMSAGAPYGILASGLRRLCKISGGTSLDDQRRQLTDRVGQHLADGERARVVAFLGELCGVPFLADDLVKLRAARADPRVMHDQIVLACLEWIAAECRQGPFLLVLEDLQWGDALTVQLVDAALRELRSGTFMVLALARPEVADMFPNLWQGRALKELPLAGLSKKACERLVQQVLGDGIAEDVVARLFAHSGGNALYLEEFIRAIRDGKADTLPGTVLAMLQARVGRLDPGSQQVLQAASVFGATFWITGVRTLIARDGESVEAVLERLLADELIERSPDSRFQGETEYTFRHGLMREAAYSLLGADSRVTGHLLAGQFLEGLQAEPIVIAEHFRRADARARALAHYVRATVQALDRNDLAETVTRAQAGLACEPAGEVLGILLGAQCFAFFWLGDIPASYEAGRRALELLPVGCAAWCKSMVTQLINVTTDQAKLAELSELARTLVAASPESAAAGTYLEALVFLLVGATAVGQRPFAGTCIARMSQIAAAGDPRDLQASMWITYGAAFHCLILESDPWRLETLAEDLRVTAEAVGLHRLVGISMCYLGLARLQGTGDDGLALVRAGLVRLRDRQEVMSEMYWTAALIAQLSDRADEGNLAVIEALVASFVDRTEPPSIILGLVRCGQAFVHTCRGRLDEAEAAMRQGHAVSEHLPAHHVLLFDTSVRLALARGDVATACAQAEAGLGLLAAIGGGGFGEVRLHLAAAEAFAAAAAWERARLELAETLRQIQARADRIPDIDARVGFLARVQENRRASELDAQWPGRGTDPR